MHSCYWKQLMYQSLLMTMFSNFLFLYLPLCLPFTITFFFNEHDIFLNFVCIFCLFFFNSIRFATWRKNWWRNKKIKVKMFFQQKCFWSEPKTFASFSGVSFVEKHEGNKWRYTKNLIKNFKSLFCFPWYPDNCSPVRFEVWVKVRVNI